MSVITQKVPTYEELYNKKMSPDNMVIFNFSLKIKDDYLDNIYNTLDKISDHKGIIPHNRDYFWQNFFAQIKFKSNSKLLIFTIQISSLYVLF